MGVRLAADVRPSQKGAGDGSALGSRRHNLFPPRNAYAALGLGDRSHPLDVAEAFGWGPPGQRGLPERGFALDSHLSRSRAQRLFRSGRSGSELSSGAFCPEVPWPDAAPGILALARCPTGSRPCAAGADLSPVRNVPLDKGGRQVSKPH